MSGLELVREARERAREYHLRVTKGMWPTSGIASEAKRYAREYSEDVPALCDALEEAEKENEALRKQAEQLDEDYWRVEQKRCEMYEENERLKALVGSYEATAERGSTEAREGEQE